MKRIYIYICKLNENKKQLKNFENLNFKIIYKKF